MEVQRSTGPSNLSDAPAQTARTSSLAFYFDPSIRRNAFILSDDISLQREPPSHGYYGKDRNKHIPAPLQHYREQQQMWVSILSPFDDREHIVKAQGFFAALSSRPDLQRVFDTKEALWKLRDGFGKLLFEVQGQYESEGLAIEVYRRAVKPSNGSTRQAFARVLTEVEEGFDLLAEGSQAALELVEMLAKKNPELADVARESHVWLPLLTREHLLGDQYNVEQLFSAQLALNMVCLKVGTLVSLGTFINREGLTLVAFNPNEPVRYQEGFSILCGESRKCKNPLPPDRDVTVFAGTNKSGKSETGLKQTFIVQLLAQSLGFTSVAPGANLRCYDRFVYIDRCAAEEYSKLSAYGTEIRNHLNTFAHTEGAKAALICIDEGFATTGPSKENQPTMWFSSVEAFRRGESRIFTASHNPHVIDLALKHPAYQVYHFAVTLNSNRTPDYHYRLEPGSSDAHSVEVARGLGFYPETLQIAEALHLRKDVPLLTPVLRKPELVHYTEAERSELKKKPLNQFEARSAGQFLKIFSSTTGSNPVFLTPDILGETFANQLEPFCGWRYRAGTSEAAAWGHLLYLERGDSKVVLERQRTFSELASRDCYNELCTLQEKILFGIKFLPWINRYPHRLLEFNREINPCIGHAHERCCYDLNTAIHFLELNRVLLGDAFEFKNLLAYCKTLEQLERRVEEKLVATSTQAAKSYIESERAVPLSATERSIFLTAAEQLLPQKPLPSEISRGLFLDLWDTLEHASYSVASFRDSEVGLALLALRSKYGALAGNPDGFEGIRVLEGLPIMDRSLREEARKVLGILPLCRDSSLPVTLEISDLKATSREILNRKNKIIRYFGTLLDEQLPAVALPAFCSDELRTHLMPLIESIKATHKNADYDEAPHHREWPKALLMALWCEQWAAKKNHLAEMVSLLRTYDSVPLHQLANTLECEFASLMPRDKGETEPDFRSIFGRFKAYSEQGSQAPAIELAGILAPLEELFSAFGMTGPLRSVWAYDRVHMLREIATVLTGSEKREDTNALPSYFHQHPLLDQFWSWEREGTDHESTLKELFLKYVATEQTLHLAPRVAETIAMIKAPLMEFADRQGILLENESYIEDPEAQIVNWASTLARELKNRYEKEGPQFSLVDYGLEKNFELAAVYALLGRHRRLSNSCEATFNNRGELRIQELRYAQNLSQSVPQWVDIGPSANPRVQSGPNMSGKSQHEKATIMALVFGHGIGAVPALSADIPLLTGTYYVERVTGKDDNTLSAAAIDLRNFDAMLKSAAKEPGLAYIAADELFSSMPAGAPESVTENYPNPDYNSCFTVAVAYSSLKQGHLLSLSVHNPAAIAKLLAVFPSASTIHFKYLLHPEAPELCDKIEFLRVPIRGIGASEAVPVALSMGYPPQFIEHAKALLEGSMHTPIYPAS